MAAQLGDKVRITAGQHAGRTGRVDEFRREGLAVVELDPVPAQPGVLNPAAAWPFPQRTAIAVEDLQRVDA